MFIKVGRGSECDLQVFHERVSRVHFILSKTPTGFVVEDMSSSGGTWVNGRKVTRAFVVPGDEVKISGIITLDWNHPVIKEFLRRNSVSESASSRKAGSGKSVKTALISVAALVVVLGTLALTGVFTSGNARTVSGESVTLDQNTEAEIVTDGVKAVIPAGAASSTVTVSVNEIELSEESMSEGVEFASSVYEFTDPGVVFDEPAIIELHFDINAVPQGCRAFPAYWKDNLWVQVSGEVQGDCFVIETDHLSIWAVLYSDGLEWNRRNNSLTDALYNVCDVLFSTDEDKWETVSEDWIQIQSNSDVFLGTLSGVEQLERLGTPVGSACVNTSIYEVYETNMPAFTGAGNFSNSTGQLAVWDFHGEEWVDDPEILFKVLYTYRCSEMLQSKDLDDIAGELEDASEDLMRMHIWHAAGSGIDILQSLLSEVLAHGSTGVPPSPTELLDSRILFALEGIVCRSEMTRFYEELNQLADDLRNYQQSEQYCFETPYITRLEDAYNRIDALAELSRATFPAFEENWFTYTSKKVLRDFLTLFVQREAAHLASQAVNGISFNSALYSAKLSSLLQLVSDVDQARGLFNLLTHALNTQGDNPLYQYYESITCPKYEMVVSFNILRDCAYILAMLDQVSEDSRFTIDNQGIITDNVTGLQWLVGPDIDTYFENAEDWMTGLAGSWRFPSLAELQELFSAGIRSDNWGLFENSGHRIWGDWGGWPFRFYELEEGRAGHWEETQGYGNRAFAVVSSASSVQANNLPLEALACGIEIGTPNIEVISILGQPNSKGERQFQGATGEWSQQWVYEGGDLIFYMSSVYESGPQIVSQIRLTGDCFLKTSHDLGIGSTEAAVISEHGSIRDVSFSRGGEFFVAGSIYGGVGFMISNGVVVSITIGAMAE